MRENGGQKEKVSHESLEFQFSSSPQNYEFPINYKLKKIK